MQKLQQAFEQSVTTPSPGAGIVMKGVVPDNANPPAGAFSYTAGEIGLRIPVIILWSAVILSVAGAAYTSVSFLKHFIPCL